MMKDYLTINAISFIVAILLIILLHLVFPYPYYCAYQCVTLDGWEIFNCSIPIIITIIFVLSTIIYLLIKVLKQSDKVKDL